MLRDVARSEKACIFFACLGALVLNKHYGIPAKVVGGGFALCVDATPQVAFFGQQDGGRLSTSHRAFHMWVQTETHIIDFMAPIYAEAFADARQSLAVPRKMFQRAIETEATTPDDVVRPGDFFTLPDPGLTESLVNANLARAANTDLLRVADVWYGTRRRRQRSTLQMGDDDGDTYDLVLPRSVATGSW